MKLVILSILTCALMACGDNIRAAEDDDLDATCLDGDCPVDVDAPDAGVPVTDADTGGGTDAGSDAGGGTDGGTGGGTDGGTGGGTDGGTGDCGTCPDGQVCVDGACVCDGEPADTGCAPDEVRLCHAPPGNPDGAHGICVGASAASAHLAHGDTLGDCP